MVAPPPLRLIWHGDTWLPRDERGACVRGRVCETERAKSCVFYVK
jgi:hypothetical protein